MNSSALLSGSAAILALLSGCSSLGPIPVHPDVEWEGENSGTFESDPRVIAVREFIVHDFAAQNALNYSSTEIKDVADDGWLALRAERVHYDVEHHGIRLWEGPPATAVTDIVGLGGGGFSVEVCQRFSPWWRGNDWSESSDPIEERLGWFRFEDPEFREGSYSVAKHEGGTWQVVLASVDGSECDPGEVAVGTYTVPLDFELLDEDPSDVANRAIGPDGEPIG